MRAKSLILLIVALGCGMIAAVAASKAVMQNGAGGGQEAMVEIFVAAKEMPQAQKISAENVRLEKWPRSKVPEGALTNLEQVEGKFTSQVIFTGEPILDRKVADSRESFSTTIPKGFRIFDIHQANAGYIKPGDHVDIIGTFKLGARNSTPETETVMRKVKVHGINGITMRDSDDISKSNTSVFQLLVKDSQLEALTLANSLGELVLNLRPMDEDAGDDTGLDTGDSFRAWLDATQNKNESKNSTLTSAASKVANLFSAPQEPPSAPEKNILIITPNSVDTYSWSDPHQLPKLVTDSGEGANAANPASGWGSGSGQVYSGYGGYPPTYPTSTTVPPTAKPPAAAPDTDDASEAKGSLN